MRQHMSNSLFLSPYLRIGTDELFDVFLIELDDDLVDGLAKCCPLFWTRLKNTSEK